jgi:hypothetical protein
MNEQVGQENFTPERNARNKKEKDCIAIVKKESESKDGGSDTGTVKARKDVSPFIAPVKKIYNTRSSQDDMSTYATCSRGSLTTNTSRRKKSTPKQKSYKR